MKITLNGQTTELPEGATMASIIEAHRLAPAGLIAALGDRVVRREQWAETVLKDGDSLELVSLVGGG